jgi:dihydrodipicolinate synthase/N-acetylneuraminate lyase
MSGSSITVLSFNCTTFTPNQTLDTAALRASLQRFVDQRITVFLASGGSGEGNSLSRDELRQVYTVGVETYRGVLPVYANLPEVGFVDRAIDLARLAIDCGVDAVNLYGPASLHGYRPTDAELTAYYDELLVAIHHPTVVAPNPIHGYTPNVSVIADVCNRHSQVIGVNLIGLDGDGYFLALMDKLRRSIAVNVPVPGSMSMLALGARGVISPLANVIPRTVREYVDAYARGDTATSGRAYADIERLNRFIQGYGQGFGGPRWQKLAMRTLGLPGGEGGLRLPYLMPPRSQAERFAEGLLGLGIAEIDDLRTDNR